MPDQPVTPDPTPRTARGTKWAAGGICVLLAALVWLVFGQTLGFDFVNFDDPENVYENTQMPKGLTVGGLAYAFTHSQVGHWDPLTTLSHLMVSQICGLAPGGHHLGNVLLHGIAAILLFLVLWRMTSALWRSAFVAAVFAIHPLHVESVAWVTERKDVLSGVFFMLTLAAYVRYVRQPQSSARYLAVAAFFLLGLMSKSMLVTLPFVLLLLDYWPLGRFATTASPRSFLATFRTLLREKIPLFGLAAICAGIQILANQKAIVSSEKMPLPIRAGNAVVAYADYIAQTFYPAGLSVFYPHPGNTLPASRIAVALSLLLAISAIALALRKTRPWFLVGWLWYLGMLVPVIGLIQSGDLARADRYTYLPQIGLCLAFTWAAAELCARIPRRSLLLGSLCAIAIAALAFTARRQTAHWRDSEALWNHSLACDPNNALAHDNLGCAIDVKGRNDEGFLHHRRAVDLKPDYENAQANVGIYLLNNGEVGEAIVHFRKALETKPAFASAHNNLGNALVRTGQFEEAIGHYRSALESQPDYPEAEANLGVAFVQTGRVANGIVHYEKALELKPDYTMARTNLANAFLQTGRIREAVDHLEKVVALKPGNALAHSNLAFGLLQSGATRDAIAQFEKALELQPGISSAQNTLAWLLATHPDATLRDGPRALTLARQASESAGGKNPVLLRTLAAACAEAGRFDEAVQTAQRALQLPEAQADPRLKAALQTQLARYQSGAPFHEGEALNE